MTRAQNSSRHFMIAANVLNFDEIVVRASALTDFDNIHDELSFVPSFASLSELRCAGPIFSSRNQSA